MASPAVLRHGMAALRASGTMAFLITSIGVVAAAIAAYGGHAAGVRLFRDERWDADLDRSVIEVLGYALVLVAAGLLLRLFLTGRAPVHAAWSGALAVLVLDDALGLHERTGEWVDRNVDVLVPPGLRTVDVGELGFWTVTGLLVGVVLYSAHRRSAAAAQAHSRRLSALIALLVVFAVGVDMLHIAVKSVLQVHRVDVALIAVEAAGEASAMAAVAAYALHLVRQP